MTTTNTAAASLSDERIDWIANCHCAGGTAYPADVKNAIREALREVTSQAEAAPSEAKRGTDAQILFERKLTCEAINGAMAFGYQNTNPPPSDEHWLAPFWNLGRMQAEGEAAIAAAGAQETAAARDVLAERQRQVTVEGWTPEHDDGADVAAMADAATCYAMHAGQMLAEAYSTPCLEPKKLWPWDASWWKPTTPRRDLVKAGALILAEIERIDRADPGTCFFCSEPMNSAHESDCPQAPTAASNGAPK